MRLALQITAVAILLFVTGAQAQEQERGFKERVLGEPDRSREFTRWNAKFYSGRGNYEADAARVKKFDFTQKVRPKEYATKDYLGTKGAWGGDFIYETGTANTEGKYRVPNKETKYKTEEVKSEKARESEKSAETSSVRDATREYLGSETDKMKSSLNDGSSRSAGWQGKLEVLSIDDVRELLNKSE
jgi:hypothetical protein